MPPPVAAARGQRQQEQHAERRAGEQQDRLHQLPAPHRPQPRQRAADGDIAGCRPASAARGAGTRAAPADTPRTSRPPPPSSARPSRRRAAAPPPPGRATGCAARRAATAAGVRAKRARCGSWRCGPSTAPRRPASSPGRPPRCACRRACRTGTAAETPRPPAAPTVRCCTMPRRGAACIMPHQPQHRGRRHRGIRVQHQHRGRTRAAWWSRNSMMLPALKPVVFGAAAIADADAGRRRRPPPRRPPAPGPACRTGRTAVNRSPRRAAARPVQQPTQRRQHDRHVLVADGHRHGGAGG